MPRSPYDPTHGDRVQIGFGGLAGTVIRRARSAGGHYFKVRLDSGEWVWPDDAVALSSGALERRCAECEIAFHTEDAAEVHCPNCIGRLERQSSGARPSRWEQHKRGSRP